MHHDPEANNRRSFRYGKLKVFTCNSSKILAEKIAGELKIELGEATVSRFADGEVHVVLEENVRECDVFIIGSTHPPAENFFELLFLADAARRSSANRITLIPAYLGYNRQDRKDRPRVSVSGAHVVQMIAQSPADRILLCDLHSDVTASFFTPLVADHVFASYATLPYLMNTLPPDFVIASPDKGGFPRASAFAKRLRTDGNFVIFSKERSKEGEVVKEKIQITGSIYGKDVLFVDDMIDTAGTIVSDAEVAKYAGAREIYVCATHALFSKNALERIDASPIKEVVITDTIYHQKEKLYTNRCKVTVLSVAPLLAEAIKRTHEGKSLSELIL